MKISKKHRKPALSAASVAEMLWLGIVGLLGAAVVYLLGSLLF